MRGTEGGDDAGVLRIAFPGGAGEDQLEPISWDEWFETFEESSLVFLYQQQKADGEDSTFFKLVKRDSWPRAAPGARGSQGREPLLRPRPLLASAHAL